MRKLIILIVSLIMAGCASISKEPEWLSAGVNASELTVYREIGSHSKALSAYFGSDSNYVVSLGEKELAQIQLPPGDYDFKIKGQGSASLALKMSLEPAAKHCIKIKADPAQWAAMMLPILVAWMPTFEASSVECPNSDYFIEYKKVEVKL